MRLQTTLTQYWNRVRGRSGDQSVVSALAAFRLTAWLLCTIAYLVDPRPLGPIGFKLAVAMVLLAAAALAIGLLSIAEGEPMQIAGLSLVEALILPVVLMPTGGLGSPFVWYALNPLLVAAVYLPTWWTWGVMVAFMGVAFGSTALSPFYTGNIIADHGQVVLILVLVTLTSRLQASLLRRLGSQAQQITDQQTALQEAYQALSLRGEALGALLEYQREAVSCSTHDQLYRTLVAVARRRFQPEWAGVLYEASEGGSGLIERPWQPDRAPCCLIELGNLSAPASRRPSADAAGPAGPPAQPFGPFAWQEAWQAAEDQAGTGKYAIVDIGIGNWSAAPLLVEDSRVVALLGLTGLAAEHRIELQVWLEYTRILAARISAGDRIRRTLDYLGDVYQFVEVVGVSHGSEELLELLTLYAKQLTRAEKAAYWEADADAPDALRPVPTIVRGLRQGIMAEDFTDRVAAWWSGPDQEVAHLDRYADGTATWHACYTVVHSSDRRYGVLFVLSPQPFTVEVDVVRTMGLLGYLAGAMLERQRAEDLHSRLLVAEEQGRIAAEIHDSVSQSLFSLVYGMQGAMASLDQGKAEEVAKTLQTLRDVAAGVSREIRTSIYELSSGDQQGTFVRAIGTFLDDLGDLYGMRAELAVTGSEDNLSPAMRRAVYRIVREGSSNAARHGRGSEILVGLSLTPQQTVIEIRDDGLGFEPPQPVAAGQRLSLGGHRGLGLLNMQQLARSFSGALEISSSPGHGTRVVVRMPDHTAYREEGGAVETASRR